MALRDRFVQANAWTLKALHNRTAWDQYRDLAIRRLTLVDGESSPLATTILVKPTPIITTVPPHLSRDIAVSGRQVTISVNDFVVKLATRDHRIEELTGEGMSYWVDGKLDESGNLVGGIECELVNLDDSLKSMWRMILVRTPDS